MEELQGSLEYIAQVKVQEGSLTSSEPNLSFIFTNESLCTDVEPDVSWCREKIMSTISIIPLQETIILQVLSSLSILTAVTSRTATLLSMDII